ncbi:MAG: pentapeptide repeat-containing protein [Cyanobacteria bacterium P01_D01_bin.105]
MRRTFKGNKKIYLFISALASMVLFLAIWRIPIVQTQHLKPATGKTLFDLENAARITLVQAFGGIFFCATTFFTWMNLINAEKTFQIAEDKLVTERFGKSVEMLSNSKTEVRIGGIYLLERISKDSPEDYIPVLEVLCAFIRLQSSSPKNKKRSTAGSSKQDIQAALEVLINRNTLNDKNLIINLRKSWLRSCYMSGIHLKLANLQDADLQDADLRGAHLDFADVKGADLTGARLEFASIKSIIWDEDTKWPHPDNMKQVKEVPKQLATRLGIPV